MLLSRFVIVSQKYFKKLEKNHSIFSNFQNIQKKTVSNNFKFYQKTVEITLENPTKNYKKVVKNYLKNPIKISLENLLENSALKKSTQKLD